MILSDNGLGYIERNVLSGTLLMLRSGIQAVVIAPSFGGYVLALTNTGKRMIVHHTDCTVLPLI